MKKHWFIHTCCSLLATALAAQNPLPLRLEEAVQRGLAYNLELKNQGIAVALAEQDRAVLGSRRAPTLNLSSDLRGNPVLQTLIVPNFSNSSSGESTQRARFGTFFNWSFTADLSYPLWDPTLRTEERIAAAERELRTATLAKLRSNTQLVLTEAWYDVFLKQEQLELSTARLQRAEELLTIARNRVNAGALLPVEQERSQLEVDNAQAAVVQARNLLEQSRQNLAYRVGLPLATPLEAVGVPAVAVPTPPGGARLTARWEIKEEQYRQGLNLLEATRLRDQYKPSVKAVAAAAVQHLSDDFAIWDNWFPVAYFGVQANLKVFDGNLKRKNLAINELQRQSIANNLSRYTADVEYELAAATVALKNAVVQWESAQKNRQTAQRIRDLDQVRFAGGALLYADARTSEYALREAETTYLSAWYNYLVARVRWEKAAGLL